MRNFLTNEADSAVDSYKNIFKNLFGYFHISEIWADSFEVKHRTFQSL